MWKYLSFRNFLTQLKEKMLREDPYTSVASRFKAAKAMHDNWRSQEEQEAEPVTKPV